MPPNKGSSILKFVRFYILHTSFLNCFSILYFPMCVQASNLKVWAGSCEDDSECRQLIWGTKWTELLSLPRKVIFITFSIKLVPQFFYVPHRYTDKASAVDLNHHFTEIEATPFFNWTWISNYSSINPTSEPIYKRKLPRRLDPDLET